MQLKSKDDNPISFGLPSGHAMVLGPEGAEVPQMLIQAAFAAGVTNPTAGRFLEIASLIVDFISSVILSNFSFS